MADDKETKVEKEVKEVKKLDDVKDSVENKVAVAEANGEKVETKVVEKAGDAVKSEPAVEKVSKKKDDKKSEEKVELEREYVVPLKRGVLKAPAYRRAKKAIRVLREFMVKHMQVRDRDLRKVKIDAYLNNELWFRGIKKPANKIKVKAVKRDGIVYVSLAEVPKAVSYIIARDVKKKAAAEVGKGKVSKKDKVEDKDKDKDGVDDKVEETEDKKAGAEKAVKVAKVEANVAKHTAQGAHLKKTAPVRKSLKK